MIKRRGFIGSMIALVIGGTVGKLANAQPTDQFRVESVTGGIRYTFGRMRVGVSPLHLCRVWLDGREVSKDCFEASDQDGYVRVYLRNDQGKFYLQHSPTCTAAHTSPWRECYIDSAGNVRDVHENCDHVAQARLTGQVTIKPADNLTHQQRRTLDAWANRQRWLSEARQASDRVLSTERENSLAQLRDSITRALKA